MNHGSKSNFLSANNHIKVAKLAHHEQQSLCVSRAKYRQGRKLTAVKAYSINDESKYIIVTNVPDIRIEKELKKLCCKYGDIEIINLLPDYPTDQFQVAYLVKYCNIKSACFAKKSLDGKNFFGGLLHTFYAPELESVEETKLKLMDYTRSIQRQSDRWKNDGFSKINNFGDIQNKNKLVNFKNINTAETNLNSTRNFILHEKDSSILNSSHDLLKPMTTLISKENESILPEQVTKNETSNDNLIGKQILKKKSKNSRKIKQTINNKINLAQIKRRISKSLQNTSTLDVLQPSFESLQRPVTCKSVNSKF